MQRFLTISAIVLPALALAGETFAAPPIPKKNPATSLLPDGSQLMGVMFPRYDKDHMLAGVLKAEAMTLVKDGEIAGRKISVEFFNPDKSEKARIDLKQATFYQEKGLLVAKEPVDLKADRMKSSGSGIYYTLEQGEGFLLGPVTTTLHSLPEISMTTPLSPARAAALLGISLLTRSLLAAPPPKVTAEEMAALQADAASRSAASVDATASTKTSLEKDLADAATASKAAAAFLVQADLPPPGAAAIPAPDKPLDLKPAASDTVIHSEGGMYFDADEGVLVYLKNVTVTDPRFNLSGANELKIFFGKKPVEEKKKDAPSSDKEKEKEKEKSGFGGSIGSNIGDVERIVATGAILIDQKSANGKEPIKASGAVFSYNIKSDQFILSGGFPWVMQGRQGFRANKPELTLRIFPKTSEFNTEGDWDTIINLEQKKP